MKPEMDLRKFRFSRLTLSLLPILGFLFLFAALWSAYLSLSVLLCSGALTCFYAASRLKKRCRCCSAVRPQYRKK